MAYELWGERYEVKTWKAMLIGVAESLYHRHARNFERILDLEGESTPTHLATKTMFANQEP